MGLIALLYLILLTTLWMWLVDPHTPYNGYVFYKVVVVQNIKSFQLLYKHEYTIKDLALNIVICMFVFYTWFYFTHLILHLKWIWTRTHYQHHEFVEQSAFGQEAVHPIEALVYGPIGHFLCIIFYPFHPITAIVLGFGTCVYALLAHKGRGDLNDHQKHHQYKECNFALYQGFWDYVCGTRYSKEKFPKEYVFKYLRDGKSNSKKEK